MRRALLSSTLLLLAIGSFGSEGTALVKASSAAITDLGIYGPAALSGRGQVALSEHGGRAFAGLWDGGTVMALADSTEDFHSAALGVNDRLQVVGFGPSAACDGCGPSIHAMLWQPYGKAQALPHLAPSARYGAAAGSEAHAINDRGEIVGWSFGGGPRGGWRRAAIWRDGRAVELAPDSPGSSAALGINNLGDIVGWAEIAVDGNRVQRAFGWAGAPRDLGSLAGDDGRSLAHDVNDRRQVTGLSATADGSTHAFLWDAGTLTDLGTLPGDTDSEALALNGHGHVVGRSYSRHCATCPSRAVVWIDGVARDLNAVAPPGLGWVLNTAIDIDDAGRIVGRGTVGGSPRFFLLELTPPE